MLLNKLEDIEHARLRAVVQVLVDKEKGVDAFEDYMKVAFPYLAGRKKQEKDDAMASLKGWVNSGPLKVTPMREEKKISSRLKQRVVAKMSDPEKQKLHEGVSKEWNKQRGL